MTKIILISGMKGVGKSSFANRLEAELNSDGCSVRTLSFANKLKTIAYDILEALGYDNAYELLYTKDKELLCLLGDRTPREFIIDLSENLIKPYFGCDVWVDDMIDTISASLGDYIIIDDLRIDNELSKIKANLDDVITINITGDTVYECKNDYKLDFKDFDMEVIRIGDKYVWKYDSDSDVFDSILNEL